LHAAFDACCEAASNRGLRVTGSEIVGMVRRNVWWMPEDIFSENRNGRRRVPKKSSSIFAIRSMGLG